MKNQTRQFTASHVALLLASIGTLIILTICTTNWKLVYDLNFFLIGIINLLSVFGAFMCAVIIYRRYQYGPELHEIFTGLAYLFSYAYWTLLWLGIYLPHTDWVIGKTPGLMVIFRVLIILHPAIIILPKIIWDGIVNFLKGILRPFNEFLGNSDED